MPRQYKRKKPACSYTVEQIEEACEAVHSRRMTYRQAQNHYKVNRSVIYQRLLGRKTSMNKIGGGRPPALSTEIENQLAQCILARAEWGYPVDREELLDIVKDYVTVNNIKTPFTNNRPGEDWYLSFMKRRGNLSLKRPEQLQQRRAEAADPFIIDDFYQKIERVIRRENLENYPELIFNCDETGFATDPSKIKAIGEKGKKSFYRRVGGTGRENISVHCCVSASGNVLPPLIIFKAKGSVQVRWTNNEEEYAGTTYATSENGFMEEPIFYSWLTESLIPYVESVRQNKQIGKKAILIMDGHKSHISLRVVNAAIAANLILLKLPSHLTHRMQPLDRCVFGPLKIGWEKILVAFGRRNLLTSFNTLNRKIFVGLLADAWKTYLPSNNIISGFRETGCFPVDSSKFPKAEYDQNKLKRFKAIRLRSNNQNELELIQPELIEPELNEPEPVEPELIEPELNEPEPIEPELNEPQLELEQHELDPIELEPNQQEPTELNKPNERESPSNEQLLANSRENVNINEPTTSDGRRTIMDVFLHKMRQEFAPQIQPKSKEKQIRLKKEQQGEILTSKQVLKRLIEEKERRKAKKPKTRKEKELHTKNNKDQNKKETIKRKALDTKAIKRKVTEFSSESDTESHLYDEIDNLPSSDDSSITGCLYCDEDAARSTNNKDSNIVAHDHNEAEYSDEDLLPLTNFKASGSTIFAPGNNYTPCAVDTYVAVDYVKKWYVGRIIEDGKAEVKIKFLERLPENKFRWPKRDDIDTVSKKLCFFGPIEIEGINTFSISPTSIELDKIWKKFKKSI